MADIAAGGGPASSSRDTGASPLRVRVWDPRLHVRSDVLEPAPERPLHERLVTDAAAAIRAEPERRAEAARQSRARRQVTVLGRRPTVFGDSAAAGIRDEAIERRRDVQTLPVDGVLWERLQMSSQRDAFVRDSVLRARARATREWKEAERRALQGNTRGGSPAPPPRDGGSPPGSAARRPRWSGSPW